MSNAQWNDTAHRFVAALAATGRQFTVDDVWRMVSLHGGGLEHENAKAMGAIMQNMTKAGVIEATPVWQASCRNADRPIRVFQGTSTRPKGNGASEDDIVLAFTAIEETARERARQMREHLRSQS